MNTNAELRKLAEAAMVPEHDQSYLSWCAIQSAFDNATRPSTIIALLDENERLRELPTAIITYLDSNEYWDVEEVRAIVQKFFASAVLKGD